MRICELLLYILKICVKRPMFLLVDTFPYIIWFDIFNFLSLTENINFVYVMARIAFWNCLNKQVKEKLYFFTLCLHILSTTEVAF